MHVQCLRGDEPQTWQAPCVEVGPWVKKRDVRDVVNRWRWLWLISLYVILRPSNAGAQVPKQFWASGTADWLATEPLTYELEVENKTNPETLEVTPAIEYTVVAWADLVAQLDFKSQVDAGTTPVLRLGVRFHILSRLLMGNASSGDAAHEKPPRQRIAVNTLIRFEKENSTWRLRDRFQLSYPINRQRTTDDGAIFWIGDCELFMPLERAPGEARVSNVRLRTGLAYRQSFAWQYQALYVWNGMRNAGAGPLVPQSWAINLRVLRQF